MDNFEKVEKIREKTGVTYEDAKRALEENNYDLLDAIVSLEKQGKVKQPTMSSYETGAAKENIAVREFEKAQQDYREDCKGSNFKKSMKSLGETIKNLLKKSIEVNFCISRDGKSVAEIPTLILILLVLFMFWVTVPLLIIGLFFGFKYSFSGVGKVVVDVNDVCDKASAAAENLKQDFKKEEDHTENE